jgi:archaellum component FlaF (FlaF/FlaG flagellin family)
VALEKTTTVDRIEVVENGAVQVRTKTAILEDGEQISGTFHRHVVAPGDDYSAEDARVQAICAATHTADVVAAYAAEQAKAAPVALPEAEA